MSSRRTARRLVISLAIATGLGVLAAANLHLVRSALLSQRDCVPHLKAPGESGQFRAAESSC
jgi:hypothetical protein